MADSEPLKHPPHARLTFRVGVVGHRPDRLPKSADSLKDLQGRIGEILAAVKDSVARFQDHPDGAFYAPGAACLRAISPLAEGSDRMFAEEALRLDFSLCCPTPFAVEEFEKDFLPPKALEADSLEHYRRLRARAREGAGLTTFELDGDRADSGAAYEFAGRVVLNQSDLLVVIWDGDKAAGRGGTVGTMQEAVGFGVPVIWVDAAEPFGWQILRRADELGCLAAGDRCAPNAPHADKEVDRRQLVDAIEEIVAKELTVPVNPEERDGGYIARDRVRTYFEERQPVINPAFIWNLFRDFVGSFQVRRPRIVVHDFVEDIAYGWPVGGAAANPVTDWINARLRGHYAWSDKVGALYADAYRSGFVAGSLLAAFAVFFALLPSVLATIFPLRAEAIELSFVWTELIIMVMILSLLLASREWRWHDRWLEYRVLAELIRQLRVLVPLGGGHPAPRAAAHLAVYGDPSRTWMYWQVRAIARDLGLPDAKVTPGYIEDCIDYLDDIATGPASGQLRFHQSTYQRSEAIHQRLHIAAFSLFFVTFLSIAAHVVIARYRLSIPLLGPWHVSHETLVSLVVLISGVFPAAGAALAGINNQGEFVRIAKRSRAMAARFSGFHSDLQGIPRQGATRLSDVLPVASEMAAAMVEENLDWRILIYDPPAT